MSLQEKIGLDVRIVEFDIVQLVGQTRGELAETDESRRACGDDDINRTNLFENVVFVMANGQVFVFGCVGNNIEQSFDFGFSGQRFAEQF